VPAHTDRQTERLRQRQRDVGRHRVIMRQLEGLVVGLSKMPRQAGRRAGKKSMRTSKQRPAYTNSAAY